MCDCPDDRPYSADDEMKRKGFADSKQVLRRYRLAVIVLLAAFAWLATYAAGVAAGMRWPH